MAIEPPLSHWQLDLEQATPQDDLVGIGADLEPGTLLMAYRAGLFPMGVGQDENGPMGWWSPDPRGVLLPGDLRISRSMRRSLRHFDIRVDTAFAEVMAGCADPSRDGGWITAAITAAYTRLFELGWAHSVEAWAGGELLGGLYGLAMGGLFAGESMFHRATDASKCALVGLSDRVFADGDPRRIIDVQWATPHLSSLGVTQIPRDDYLARLEGSLPLPIPPAFGR
jgi:leucyl/phenylalanyl-tRNA--protein transferase